MPEPFFESTGTLLSPGDLLGPVPYARVPHPLKVARKVSKTLPKNFGIQGELREILDLGVHSPSPGFNFDPPGEEILTRSPMAMAIFLTWGSEVDDDKRGPGLHKKHWLIAPVFPLKDMNQEIKDARSGKIFRMADVIRAGQSPRFFAMPPLPNELSEGSYIDFRKICPLSASYFEDIPRQYRLAAAALNDFYHQLIWFFTRRKLFFGPIECPQCGAPVDLKVVFEGQPLDPEGTA
jgi:hypothetical protein